MTAAITEAEYRADDALSATGMKHLLRSPKHYRHYIDNPSTRADFDFGHAVHADVLGVGQPLVEIPADILASNGATSTKAAKESIAEAREAGGIPLKAEVIAAVRQCADAVRAHPKAAWLLGLPGESEVAMEATDEVTGVRIKSRLDRLATLPDGRKINIDLKTTGDVRRIKIMRHIEDFGYDIQSEVYKWQIAQAFPDAKVAPTHLIFVEADAPHEVRVIQLAHEDWINGGRAKMRHAINVYKQCVDAGAWPGDDDDDYAAEPIAPRPYYLDNIQDDIQLED